MKKWKKIKVLIFGALSIFAIVIGFKLFTCKVYAADPTTPEEPIVETTEDTTTTIEEVGIGETEEVITITKKLDDFINTWLIPTTSGALGFIGSLLSYLILRLLVKKLEKRLERNIDSSEEERQILRKEIDNAKKELENAKQTLLEKQNLLQECINSFEVQKATLLETQKNLLTSQRAISEFKELIGLLVASSPELAKNGYASQVLELLNEGKGDNNGTNN